MTTYILACSMILTAGCAVRFVSEVSKNHPRMVKLLWHSIELIALASLFRFYF